MSWHLSTFWFSSDIMSQTSVNLTETLLFVLEIKTTFYFGVMGEGFIVVLTSGFNNCPVVPISSLLMSWHRSTFWFSSDLMSYTLVKLTQTFCFISIFHAERSNNKDNPQCIQEPFPISSCNEIIIFCVFKYVKKIFQSSSTVCISSFVVHILFFLFLSLQFLLQKNPIKMKTKSKSTFQSGRVLPSANFVKSKVVEYLDIKVLAGAFAQFDRIKRIRMTSIFTRWKCLLDGNVYYYGETSSVARKNQMCLIFLR